MEPPTRLEQAFTEFLKRLSEAATPVDMNIAAGTSLNEYLGLDQEEAA